MDVSEADLQRAIKSMLIKRNDFDKIRAEMRTKIIEILREKDPVPAIPAATDPHERTKPQTVLNKLILQYFSWFGYKYAAEVFATESGVNQTEVDCSDVVSLITTTTKDGNAKNAEQDRDLPILLNIIINMMIDE